MTPDRFRRCLEILDWTQRGVARQLGRTEGTVRQWVSGLVRIPDDVAEWLELRARHAERHPPPGRASAPQPEKAAASAG